MAGILYKIADKYVKDEFVQSKDVKLITNNLRYDYERKFNGSDVQRIRNIYIDKQIKVNTKFILKSQDYDLLIDNYDVVDLELLNTISLMKLSYNVKM